MDVAEILHMEGGLSWTLSLILVAIARDVRNIFFTAVRFLFGFLKKLWIWFGMSLVRFSENMQFGSDIIVIYYSRNSKYYSDSG